MGKWHLFSALCNFPTQKIRRKEQTKEESYPSLITFVLSALHMNDFGKSVNVEESSGIFLAMKTTPTLQHYHED